MSKPEPTRYRTANWKSYNDALKRRGLLLVWLDWGGFVRLLGPECYDPLLCSSGGQVHGIVCPKAERVRPRMTV